MHYHSLFAVAVVRTATEWNADHATWECHKQGMMVLVQLQSQYPTVLTTHITSEERNGGLYVNYVHKTLILILGIAYYHTIPTRMHIFWMHGIPGLSNTFNKMCSIQRKCAAWDTVSCVALNMTIDLYFDKWTKSKIFFCFWCLTCSPGHNMLSFYGKEQLSNSLIHLILCSKGEWKWF